MIEGLFRNALHLKRYRRFKKRKLAVISLFLLLIMAIFSFTAEIWSNSRPLVLMANNEVYFPVFRDYHPKLFGITDSLQVDYRRLVNERNFFALWPLNPWDPFESNTQVETYPSPPTTTNWLGTDDRGRDIFARLLYGVRYSLSYAFLVWGLVSFLAIIFGGIMGYFGGKIDFWGQRVVEILNTVPQFFLLIIFINIFRPGLFMLVALSATFGWISMSYYVRGEFLKNRKLEFVEGARSVGGSNFHIIFHHVLPNSLGPIITYAPFILAANVTSLAGLDFLGFGLMPPTPSWGELLNQAQKHFTTSWWLAVFPSFALFFTLTILALIGEAVRDAMDPRL